MKRPSYKQLDNDLRQSQNDFGAVHCAFNDLINGKVTWFRAGKTRIGTSRENGASGGLVIHRQFQDDGTSYSSAYNWENWFPQIRDSIPANNDKEGIDLRNAALQAHEHVLKMQVPIPAPAPNFFDMVRPVAHDLTAVLTA